MGGIAFVPILLQKSQIARRQFSCCKKIRPTSRKVRIPWQKMVVGYSWWAQDDIAVKMAHTISLSSALPGLSQPQMAFWAGVARSPQWRGRRTHPQLTSTDYEGRVAKFVDEHRMVKRTGITAIPKILQVHENLLVVLLGARRNLQGHSHIIRMFA